MKINKLKTIYNILDKFDTYRSTNNNNKLIANLSDLRIEIFAIMELTKNKSTFHNILQFISDDVQYEIDKAVESVGVEL